MFSKKSKRKKRYLTFGIVLFFFFSNPYISNRAFKLLEGEPLPYPSKKYSTAIVLTGMVNIDKSPRDRIYMGSAADRFYQALELYDKGLVDKILVTGGHGIILGDYPSESMLLKDAYIHAGVKETDLIIEPNSRNTHENALFTKELIKEQNLEGPFILITSAFHMPRASGCFEKAGVNTDFFPVHFITSDTHYTLDQLIIPSSDALYKWDVLIHESIGLIAYKLLGRI